MNFALTKKSVLLAPLVLINTAFAQIPGYDSNAYSQLTPEQVRQYQQDQMQRIAQLQQLFGVSAGAGLPGMLQPSAVQQPTANPVTQPSNYEESVLAQISSFGPSKGGIAVTRHKDGFSIDGVRYVDYEGAITNYAFDALTGDVTYLVSASPNQYKIKTMRARSGVEPVTIATAANLGGNWQVTTASGKTLTGWRIIPLSRGVMVARDNVSFKYVPGKGIANIVGPENFSFASAQNGDIEGTGFILMERIKEPSERSNTGEFLGTLQALGSLLGVSRKDDYLLLNINTGTKVPINVALEGNMVNIYSHCRASKYKGINQCEQMDSYQSLWDPKTNTPNLTHYFWRISWFKTVDGPVVIAQEGGLSEINATNMSTGKKVALFSRTLGIAGYSVKQGADGKLTVTAQMGLSNETIDDVASFMAKEPVMVEAKTQTTAVEQTRFMK